MPLFLMKARQFLQANDNHIAILKLRRNEPLTLTDLAELERIFVEAGVSEAELDAAKAEGGLGLFIRSLVGLDREAAERAFAGFIPGRTLSANQLEFIGMIIDHLTERGTMDARLLYDAPFTDRKSDGPRRDVRPIRRGEGRGHPRRRAPARRGVVQDL